MDARCLVTTSDFSSDDEEPWSRWTGHVKNYPSKGQGEPNIIPPTPHNERGPSAQAQPAWGAEPPPINSTKRTWTQHASATGPGRRTPSDHLRETNVEPACKFKRHKPHLRHTRRRATAQAPHRALIGRATQEHTKVHKSPQQIWATRQARPSHLPTQHAS